MSGTSELKEGPAMRAAPLAALVVLSSLGAARAAPETSAARPAFGFPLACQIGRTCEVQHYVDRDPGPAVRDYKCGRRSYNGHNGVDIRILDMAAQRAGVAVLAAAPGRVARLRDGVADISIHAPGAPSVAGQECGNGVVIDHGNGWETQYCHVAKGSVRVKVGDAVAAGTPLAKVGLSGNTEFPHLHFTVRRAGKVVDPFAPDASNPAACNAQQSLWTGAASRQMSYKAGAILNAGLTGAPVTMQDVENGAVAPPGSGSAYVVAYARAIELELGDTVEIALTGPGGARLANATTKPLDHDKAQYISFVGKKRPATGWPRGVYAAQIRVHRKGAVVLQRQVQATL
jgi:murein DD-endopeptidase MepM/ murein hydrolase activator NlpD